MFVWEPLRVFIKYCQRNIYNKVYIIMCVFHSQIIKDFFTISRPYAHDITQQIFIIPFVAYDIAQLVESLKTDFSFLFLISLFLFDPTIRFTRGHHRRDGVVQTSGHFERNVADQHQASPDDRYVNHTLKTEPSRTTINRRDSRTLSGGLDDLVRKLESLRLR